MQNDMKKNDTITFSDFNRLPGQGYIKRYYCILSISFCKLNNIYRGFIAYERPDKYNFISVRINFNDIDATIDEVLKELKSYNFKYIQ